eukprot:gb/GECG01001597.1/.p1 GENE.gb/GECG01001597.1/~~gb/GECG01001597.1/.p1  ORF type:complete len:687 (+),score=79.09 gb/GECG01001597.1/:1-2061(+)
MNMALQESWNWVLQLPSHYIEWWKTEYERAPVHIFIETALIILVLYIVFVKRSYDPSKKGSHTQKLSEHEVQRVIDEWEPEPLVPPAFSKTVNPKQKSHPTPVVITKYSKDGVHIETEGVQGQLLNLASSDFLGLGSHEDLKKEAAAVLETYTCGSCGPRGFYGTTDKHLQLEDAIARFMGTPESITYSDATSTVVSAIPAFAKRGDLLIVDSGVNHAVQNGCRLSRGKVLFFEHNDTDDLERVLREVREAHKKRKISTEQRRFIVVEGLYANHGDICPLDKIVELKDEYNVRLIVDDSCGWCVLGNTGRGTVEHFSLSINDIDVLLGSLSNSMASVGGFCVGNREVVDHQRLSGAGYCFSASCPPFLCAVAQKSLEIVEKDPSILTGLRSKCKNVHQKCATVFSTEDGNDSILCLRSCEISPIVHLSISGSLRKLVGDISKMLTQLEWDAPANFLRRNRMKEVKSKNDDSAPTGTTLTHGRYAVSGFEDTITGSTSIFAKSSHIPEAKCRLYGDNGISVSTFEEAVAHVMYRESQDVLTAVRDVAIDHGVLITHSRYLATDSLAPEPTLKMLVSAALSESQIDKAIEAVNKAAQSVFQHYQSLVEERIQVIRDAIATNKLLSGNPEDANPRPNNDNKSTNGLDVRIASSYAAIRGHFSLVRNVLSSNERRDHIEFALREALSTLS